VLHPTLATLRPSTRISKPPENYGFSFPLSLTTTITFVPIPSSYRQAMEHKCWRKAIETELLAPEENQT